MTLNKNINYFIECGDDIEMVIRFVEKRGGYLNWSTKDLRLKLLSLKTRCENIGCEMGGILLSTEEPLWTDIDGMNDGHLEIYHQPLVRVKSIVVSKLLTKLEI